VIKRTFDYRIVKRMVSWPIQVSNEVFYLIHDDTSLLTLEKYKDGLMLHADMSKKCRGKKVGEGVRQAFQWILDNTGIKHIYANIPVENKPSWYMAAYCGMIFKKVSNGRRCYQKTLGENYV